MSSSSFFVSVFQKFEGVACVQSVGSYVAVFEESLTKATKFGKTEVKRKAREREKKLKKQKVLQGGSSS